MNQRSLFHDSPSWIKDRGLFQSLNSHPDEWAKYVRSWLDTAFSHYPTTHSKDLRERFRSKDDRQHQAAYFEILIHILLRSTGYSIEVHPQIKGCSKTPDFLVNSDRGPFVVEAKTIQRIREDKHNLTKPEENIVRHLESFPDKLFYFHVVFTGSLNEEISKREIQKEIAPLRKWGRTNYEILKSGKFSPRTLIDDAIRRDETKAANCDGSFIHDHLHLEPRKDVARIKRGEWTMYVSLYPRSNPSNDPYSAFGIYPYREIPFTNIDGTGRCGIDDLMHRKLSKWNRDYKNISPPTVLAVHIIPNHGVPVGRWLTQFMYGKENLQSPNTPSVHDGWFTPSPNGAERHFHAVWAFTGLSPALMFNTRHQLYANPAKPGSLIPTVLSRFASSNIMANTPPGEIGQALDFDYSIGMHNEI
ncbi:MAG: hypothetical protein OXH03_06595 [Bacteroidetes bacterium]|nr:hypothetical protein [Bacteroidota bacterium]MDE2672037.1 hypothetical protein [Bacteroidota bacterium]